MYFIKNFPHSLTLLFLLVVILPTTTWTFEIILYDTQIAIVKQQSVYMYYFKVSRKKKPVIKQAEHLTQLVK